MLHINYKIYSPKQQPYIFIKLTLTDSGDLNFSAFFSRSGPFSPRTADGSTTMHKRGIVEVIVIKCNA